MYIAFEYLVWETNAKLLNEEGGRTIDHTFIYIVAIVYEIHTEKSIITLFCKLLICIYYINYANFCATHKKYALIFPFYCLCKKSYISEWKI